MLFGFWSISFSTTSFIVGLEDVAFVGDEVLTSREARGLVGEGRGDVDDIVWGWVVVGCGLAGMMSGMIRRLGYVDVMIDCSLKVC